MRGLFVLGMGLGLAGAWAAALRGEKTIDRERAFQYFPAPESDPRLVDRLVRMMTERNRHLVRDNYNLNARAYSSDSSEEAPPDRRAQIRAALHVPDALPALAVEQYGEVTVAPGIVAERVSYATDYGLRVPAMVYRPAQRPAGKMPGLIVVNGHGGDKYSWYAFYAGILYARMGAVVLTYDPIGEGERNAQRKNGTRQHDKDVEPIDEMGCRMGGLMMTDVMQATSYLEQRADVDAKRLAAMGYSMGSFVLGLACAAESRLSACVLTGGGNLDGPGGYWDSSSKRMCQAVPYQAMKFLDDRGLELYKLHPATLVWNGSADTVVAMENGREFFADMKRRLGAKDFEFGFTEGGGHRPYFVARPAAEWLEKHLHFPMWKAEGETHISEWAAKNQVAMDKQYATELSEGGTIALGTGVPGVAHDLLDALPREKWEAEKEKYVYETWVREAKARGK